MPDTSERGLVRRSRFSLAASAAVAVAAVVAGCAAEPDTVPSSMPTRTAEPTPSVSVSGEPSRAVAPQGTPAVVTTDLNSPWSIVVAGSTALISERDTGNILELAGGTTRVVGTIPEVVHRGESGLLGLAVDDQDRLYAYSTGPDGNRIQRFDLSGSPGQLALGEPATILEGIPAANVHDGGRIAFGPDGMLYATAGDAGQRDSAQSLESLGGKILRMTPDGAVPSDNPFPGSLVYSYGHRNPQGIAWDSAGRLFAAEFGQDTWDELNIITAGANYGWPEVEGIAGDGRFSDPVQQWAPDAASPSGIAIIGDTLFIANLRGETLRAVPVSDPTGSTEYFTGEYGRLRHVAEAPDGALWLLTSNTDGRGDVRDGDDRLLSIPLGSG